MGHLNIIMAAEQSQCSVTVLVLVLVVDGSYSALNKLGFPIRFSTLAYLQDAGLLLETACWDIKKSCSGFSVSFFWPTAGTTKAHNSSNKNKKKKRRSNKKSQIAAGFESDNHTCHTLSSKEARYS